MIALTIANTIYQATNKQTNQPGENQMAVKINYNVRDENQ